MQLQDIRTEILETAGLASDDARFPDATLNRIVNRALRQLSAEHDWPWNQSAADITTASGTQGYSPGTSWESTIRLRYDNRDLVEYQPGDTSQFHNDTGAPVGFFVEGGKVNLVPTPDGVYTVRHYYYAYETGLVDDTDVPALPDRYMDYLVAIALIQVAARIRDTDLHAIADRERRHWHKRASDEVRKSAGTIKVQARNDWFI